MCDELQHHQTTTGTTRTTSSSQCTTSTPMTTLTSTIAWCTSYVESAHRAHCSTLYDNTAHLMAQVLSPFIVIHGHTHGAFSLTRSLLSSFTGPSCFSRSSSSIPSCSLSSTTRSSWQVCATPSQKRVRDTLTSFTSHTGYEPNLLTFGDFNDSSVPFFFMILSTDQDVDDVTLGKLLTAAHRGQVDCCVARERRSPRHAQNRRRRTRQGPEPACVR